VYLLKSISVLFILIACSLAIENCYAEGTFRGKVVLNTENGAGVGNVIVNFKRKNQQAIAKTCNTDVNGNFQVDFDESWLYGDPLMVEVMGGKSKTVVNVWELSQHLSSNRYHPTVQLIVCEEKDWPYYFNALLEKTLGSQLASSFKKWVEDQGIDIGSSKELLTKVEQLKQALEFLITQLQPILGANIDEYVDEVVDAFIRGALGRTDDQLLPSINDFLANQIYPVNVKAQICRLKAVSCIANLQFKEAELWYQAGCNLMPQDLHLQFEYAYYLEIQREYDASKERYAYCLSIKPVSKDSAAILLNLGQIHMIQHDPKLAKQHYDQAMMLLGKLSHEENAEASTIVVSLRNSLGSYYFAINQLEDAKYNYNASLAVNKANKDRYPDLLNWKVQFAAVNNNLGLVAAKQNKPDVALRYFVVAIDQYEDLRDSSDEVTIHLAKSYHNAADQNRALGRDSIAIIQDSIANARIKHIANHNYYRYEPFVFTIKMNLGNREFRRMRYSGAEQLYHEASNFAIDLAEQDKKAYENLRPRAKLSLAKVYDKLEKAVDARDYFRGARNDFENLLNENRQLYLWEFTTCCHLEADFLYRQGIYEEASQLAARAIDCYNELGAKGVLKIAHSLASSYSLSAKALVQISQDSLALEHMNLAIQQEATCEIFSNKDCIARFWIYLDACRLMEILYETKSSWYDVIKMQRWIEEADAILNGCTERPIALIDEILRLQKTFK
jgi:tetratricopeptide (TPR) repeat protein